MNKIEKIIYALLFTFIVIPVHGQISGDEATLAAMIDNHKSIEVVASVRTSVESACKALHVKTGKACLNYDSALVALDKYRRAFDILDLVLKGSATGIRFLSTYNVVKQRVEQCAKLLDDYRQVCINHGNIQITDTVIINTLMRFVQSTRSEVLSFSTTVAELAYYATPASGCTTATLMSIFNSLDASLRNLRMSVNSTYWRLWQYITNRTHFWKPELYQYNPAGRAAITSGALARWKESFKLK